MPPRTFFSDIANSIKEHFPDALKVAKAHCITLEATSPNLAGSAKFMAVVAVIEKLFAEDLKMVGHLAGDAARIIANAGFEAAAAEVPKLFPSIVKSLEAVAEKVIATLVNQSPLAAADVPPQTKEAPNVLKNIVTGLPSPPSPDSKTTSQTHSGK